MGVFSGSQFNSLNNMGFTVSVGGYGANISTGYRGKINQTNNITWQARAAGDSVDGGTLTLNSSTILKLFTKITNIKHLIKPLQNNH
jgi:hypothetical protein